MIDVYELRLGNYVLAKGIITEVDHLLQSGINLYESEVVFTAEEIEPIPLTPHMLCCCGFTHAEHSSPGFYEHTKYKWFVIGGNTFFQFYVGATPIGAPLKSVHQLQNLYFALTGEELQIKHTLHLDD